MVGQRVALQLAHQEEALAPLVQQRQLDFDPRAAVCPSRLHPVESPLELSLWQRLQQAFVGRSHALAEKPSQVLGELGGPKALVEGADDFYSGLDLGRGLELAEPLIAGRIDLGKVLVQAQGLDLLKEGVQGGRRDCGAEASNEGCVLLEGGIERACNAKAALREVGMSV